MTHSPRSVRQALVQSGLVPVDAQVLLAHVLGVDRAWLAGHATDPLRDGDAMRFLDLARQRRVGVPVAHLVGRREFWTLDLEITPDVLIPRPETEVAVEQALLRIAPDRPARVLDLGTGSGAIALALAHERPRASVVATDRSPEALEVAQRNATRNGVANVVFALSDWYSALPPQRFDAIVSNPPYVRADDPHLGQDDVRYEPPAALVAGADGLESLRVIIADASRWLADGGWLIVEHGYDQVDRVRDLMNEAGLAAVVSTRDLAGIPRVLSGRLPAGR